MGTTDGAVRLYDSSETELKFLTDRSTKGNPVTCLDIKRVDKNNNVFVVCGHQRGHISFYEIKGLIQ